MAIALLARIAAAAGTLLIVAFAAVVVLKIASGRISLAGLLQSKEGDDAGYGFSPGRLQMLIATVVVAGRYLYLVMSQPHLDALPSLPPSVVAVLGGSHVAYLGGKAFKTYIQPLLKILKDLK